MLTFISEGFPEFTRFFNHSHLWKLQHLRMKFPMTIRAQQDALFNFFPNLYPTSRITFMRYAEVFLRRVKMMKLKSFKAAIIATNLAITAFVLNSHLSDFLSATSDRFD